MKFITAKSTNNDAGPLTRIVMQYAEMVEERAVANGAEPESWEPLAELVEVDEFKRVGAYLEVMNWEECTRFLSKWAGSTRFETTVYQVTEVENAVFMELEERHYKEEDFIKKNVMAVFRFSDRNRIVRLDIYEQADDSGQWIIDAAKETTGASETD